MRWSVVVLSLASCFDPTYPEIGCGPDGWCPAGQSCGSDGLCHHPPDAAAPPDAVRADGRADGAVGPDAAPTTDATTDTTPPTATHTPASAVLQDDVAVVVTFSESMSTASLSLGGTLAAYPYSASWTTTAVADDTLTVSPAAATPFWPASDPARTLIVDADDLAGNPLLTYTITYDAPPLESFVSSAGGAAVGGVTGFDALCQSVAASADLHGTWVAWVSSSTSDVYCRLHGLTGKRATNCSQTTLPLDAGPWIRPDGAPFLELVGGAPHQLTAPLLVAGGGYVAAAGGGQTLWSSTDVTGAFVGATDCAGWTTNTGGTPTLGANSMVRFWTSGGGVGSCGDTTNWMVCLEVGRGGPLPPQPTGKRVFITSAMGTGDLSTWAAAGGNTGVAAGDAICRSHATAAGLPNATALKAWLSTNTQGAASRLTSNGPWVRWDGVVVASSKADLTDGWLNTSILYDQTGVLMNTEVYTGTTWGGSAAPNTCGGWTSTAGYGVGADSDYVTDWWTAQWDIGCTATAHLFCFED